MTEVDYVAGYYMSAPLGKGLGIIAMKASGVATGETITTPFIRCVPVAVPASGGTPNADNTFRISESEGTVTFTIAGTDLPTVFGVIIVGAMYGTV